MQRYFLSAASAVDGIVEITGADFHHLARVMRMRPGDRVEVVLLDQVFEARVEAVDKNAECARLALIAPVSASRESHGSLTLLQGLPKGEKIDQIIRQACEIGAARIIVFEAKRSVAVLTADKLAAKLTRWRKIAKEACEQAHRDLITDVQVATSAATAVQDFYDSVAGRDDLPLLVIPYESQTKALSSLREALHGESVDQKLSTAIGIVIGPEGGFDEAEIADMEQRGGVAVSLGSRILRTETAGVAVAAVVMYEWGEWVAPGADRPARRESE
ncbi:MAG: RsmE family RNA methyltransferase [Firmicutes bacterium]|nr:RsmE family RNA methyltransferase [Bacillota bacterium]